MSTTTHPSPESAGSRIGVRLHTPRRRALIVGLGVSGLAAAIRLSQTGWDVVAVERAATRRGGGYMIGLFGVGQAAAERMGLLQAIGNRFDADSVNYEVDRSGRRRPGMSMAQLPGKPYLLLRGDIERTLFAALPDAVEVRFGTSPTAIRQDEHGVTVTTEDVTSGATRSERFDLVVGADGVHSTVRRLVFGPDGAYVRSLDHVVAATILQEPVAGFRANDGLTLAEPGRAAWVFPFANHAPAVMLTYRSDDLAAEFQRPPAESLRRAFGPEALGPVLERLIDQYERAEDKLFDTAEQVQMSSWIDGRVILLGDAAWCMTLYSGMGVSLGLAGADILATKLQRHPDDLQQGLRAWEAQLRPFVDHYQREARSSGLDLFVPGDRRTLRKRAMMMRLMRAPLIGNILTRVSARSRDAGMKALDYAAA